MQNNISKKLREIIKISKLTQEKLAQKLGVSFPSLNAWINNKARPRKNHRAKIEILYKRYTGQYTISEKYLLAKQIPILSFCKNKNLFELINQRNDLLKDFTLKLTYNSNRIEGSTLTEAETSQVIFADTALSNKPLREQIEAKNHQSAFLHILDAIKKNQALNENFILHAHQILMNGILPEAGFYRNHSVRIVGTQVITANHLKITTLMQELEKSLLSPSQNIIRHITKIHADFEKIHPFPDGNGRCGRLIMQMMALKNNLPPVLVLNEKKQFYYTCLTKAQNEQDYSLLENFIINAMQESIEIMK